MSQEEDSTATEAEENTCKLFHVKGSTEDCCKGVEVGFIINDYCIAERTVPACLQAV